MKMNKRGQTLVLFVIFIPIFIIFCAFVIDNGMILNKKSHALEVTKTIVEQNKESFYEEDFEKIIKEYYEKNKIDTKDLKITRENNQIIIENTFEENRIFGSIVGLKKATIKIKVVAKLENNKISFE